MNDININNKYYRPEWVLNIQKYKFERAQILKQID